MHLKTSEWSGEKPSVLLVDVAGRCYVFPHEAADTGYHLMSRVSFVNSAPCTALDFAGLVKASRLYFSFTWGIAFLDGVFDASLIFSIDH